MTVPQNIRDIIADLDYLGFDTASEAVNAILTHSDFEDRWDFSEMRDSDWPILIMWRNKFVSDNNVKQIV